MSRPIWLDPLSLFPLSAFPHFPPAVVNVGQQLLLFFAHFSCRRLLLTLFVYGRELCS